MKSMIALLAVAFMSQASWASEGTLNCMIKEGGGAVKKETVVSHVVTEDSHSMTHFETAFTTGFISVSRGYSVVNLVSKEDKRVFTFFGDYRGGRGIGGTFYLADKVSWVQVDCF
ncbi:MAG: hypothetical protein AAGB31_08400 [Bdellovibrio sp.]